MNRRLATIPGAACPGAACFAVGLALLTLAGAVAAEPSPPGLAQSVADLRDEVRALRDSVAELRQGIEAQRKGRGDLQPVTMQIVSADERAIGSSWNRFRTAAPESLQPAFLTTTVSPSTRGDSRTGTTGF
ncbi:hypothetical protein Pla108_33840 [Botrimarina colliarenosi]|uniref:Uncharacterized protein n=1 Tax=Botrimarina colliarenosi TaxID=2528001 RepID=A0A5C6A888_9BACT|nr:hypothetical protein [Botrimarina colliarenosi]TWT95241.1 hypothetical protein Pla108_33840 [Botrimarina colliarenosi]